VGKRPVQVDGVNKEIKLTSAPYMQSLDTKTLAKGSHTIVGIAADAAGIRHFRADPNYREVVTAPVTAGRAANKAFLGCYYSGMNFDTLVIRQGRSGIPLSGSGIGPQAQQLWGRTNYSVLAGNFSVSSRHFPVRSDTDEAIAFTCGQYSTAIGGPHGSSAGHSQCPRLRRAAI